MNECKCKGIRTCLLCERAGAVPVVGPKVQRTFYQCYKCGKISENAVPSREVPPLYTCSESCVAIPTLGGNDDGCKDFCGILVVKDFLTQEEEEDLVATIDSSPWAGSQEGRKKQDYGIKVNFKQRKAQLGHFTGLPAFSRPLVDSMHVRVPELTTFNPVELCNLEYCTERGSAITPHLDDSWIWGPRLVTITLLSSTVMTFINWTTSTEVLVSLPRRSLLVVHGAARYEWMHSIKREHIMGRRIGITLRELSDEFLAGGSQESLGREILGIAAGYEGHPTNSSVVL